MPYKENIAIRCSWCREWTLRSWFALRKSKTGKAFCNKTCQTLYNQNKWQSTNRRGPLHHNWRGGFKASQKRYHEKKNNLCIIYSVNCVICKKLFVAKDKHSRCCSAKCYKKVYEEERIKRERNRHNQKWKNIAPLICKECDISFKPEYGHPFKLFCSIGCQDQGARAYKRIRRLIYRGKVFGGEKISLGILYKRDGGQCQRCNRQLRRLSVVPNKRAPTIDHIIPLSLGGKHKWDNVQLMCFRCNSLKGDRIIPEGDQLRLAI